MDEIEKIPPVILPPSKTFPKNFLAKLCFVTTDLKSFSKSLILKRPWVHHICCPKYVLSKISCPRFCHFYHTCIVLLGLIHLSWENGIMTCGSQHRSLIKDDSLFGHGHLSCMGKRVWTRENQVVKCNFTL